MQKPARSKGSRNTKGALTPYGLLTDLLYNVKAVEVHHLVPRPVEVEHEDFFTNVVARH